MSSDSIPYGVPETIASDEGQIDPYPFFERMRANDPVRYGENRDVYDVFRYDDVKRVMTEEETFTKADVPKLFDKSMADVRGEEYRKVRGVVDDAFTPRAVMDLRPELEELADDVLDSALAGSGPVSFVEDVAKPYPIRVIARMLGVPEAKMDTFREWSLALTDAPSEMTMEASREDIENKKQATAQMSEFFDDLLDKRERDPRDDMLTVILEAEQESEYLERQHSIDLCNILLLAGNVTTTTLLTNAVWTFDEENVLGDLRDGSLDLEPAIEETLRYRSPVMRVERIALETAEIGDVTVESGDILQAWISSAHRDEQIFDNPDVFDPSRDNLSKHYAFGEGMRFCLGAHLARLEADIMLTELLDRTENLTVQESTLKPYISPEIYGPKELSLSVST